MANRIRQTIGFQEAMDNLAAIHEIDISGSSRIGILNKRRIVTNEKEFPMAEVSWLSAEGSDVLLELLDTTYLAVLSHLQSIAKDGEERVSSKKIKNGMAIVMAIVGESVDKAEKYLSLQLEKPCKGIIKERPAFQQLEKYYSKVFLEEEKGDLDEFDEEKKKDLLLHDFEAVKRDEEYELFSIHGEDGSLYFDPNLLRNIKLEVDFSSEGEFEEDPFLKVRAMKDRDFHVSAAQIVHECQDAISDFLKISKKYVENRLIYSLNRSVFALFLAANPRHLIQNTFQKSCLDYFLDFQKFLREALQSDEYKKWLAFPPGSEEKGYQFILHLVHRLCHGLFFRGGGIKQEAIGMIHRCMRKGEEVKKDAKKKVVKSSTLWNEILLGDENMRTLMSKFPHGPLFKTLDLIREEEREEGAHSFDPIGQENLPMKLFDLAVFKKPVHVLRIPSPTRQFFIHKAEIIEEFQGFLRSLTNHSSKKHLIVNLQDKTSWKESARSQALEQLSKNAEFSEVVFVLTLTKDTNFYYQNGEYLDLSSASEFMKVFKEQLQFPEESGFLFPSKIKASELERFVDSIFAFIHKHFFSSQKRLTRREREDFIEIFYQFLILKTVEWLGVDSLSFTCKDAIDTGAVENALMYGFLKLLISQNLSKEESDFLLWLLYAPALLLRERITNVERVVRALSILETVQLGLTENKEKVLINLSDIISLKTTKRSIK